MKLQYEVVENAGNQKLSSKLDNYHDMQQDILVVLHIGHRAIL